ncbi:MAG: NAD(P)/FAD-dependent oxidoreductase [Polyangiaceae bacterium]|jgi:cation diffusion facilitator CzcD-associated flavoprotein CzcO
MVNVHERSVLIVGSGFAGLGMAIRLKQAGIDDFVVLEQADDVGGTWRDNHYPGCACDVPSHLYSFSFEPWPGWTRDFAPQGEILEYLRHCTDKYGIRPHIRFGARVVRARWDEADGVWEVTASDGDTWRARVVVSGCGPLSRPQLPDIPGLASFAGKTFHSARWDHTFALDGKTVAVVGTGASAVQIVPEIAPKVEKLFVYQRTAPWVMPKPDGPIAPWKRRLYARVPAAQNAARQGIYWSRELLALGFVVEPRIMKLGERLARRYLARRVADPALRAKLTPSYTMGCKRVLPTNHYLPALQRENVELVTDGIAEVRAHSILSKDGTERAVDAIVLATGFEAAEQVAPFEVLGRAGRELNEAWRDGASAYLGTAVSGFPNLFLLVGPNTGLGHSSMVFMIESQVAYVMDALKKMRARGLKAVDVKPETLARYNARLQERLKGTVWSSGCMSWYLTRSGKNTTIWPGFTVEFRLRTRRFDLGSYDQVRLAESAVDAKNANGAQPAGGARVAHAPERTTSSRSFTFT